MKSIWTADMKYFPFKSITDKKKTRLQSFNIENHNKETIWEKFTNDYFILVKDSGETRNFKNWNTVILQFTTIYR